MIYYTTHTIIYLLYNIAHYNILYYTKAMSLKTMSIKHHGLAEQVPRTLSLSIYINI